jgi:stage IV sporulation protein FB
MRRLIEVPTPIRLQVLTLIMRIRGVDVFVHWTLFVVAALMVWGAVRRPLLALAAVIAYPSVLLIHECGHMIAAHRKGCHVHYIELYPICGLCYFEVPWSRIDRAVIAWGGVLAQAIVGLPIAVYLIIFGYTPFEPMNAVLALLGPFSLAIAVFNLLPLWRLDGMIAWDLIPALFERSRERRNRRPPVWKHR